jgi:hypothetical protein
MMDLILAAHDTSTSMSNKGVGMVVVVAIILLACMGGNNKGKK